MSEDGYIYGVTIEFENQAENMISKCKLEHNAFLIAKYIIDCTKANPILRIVNLETKECLGSYQREVKELEKTSALF